MSSESAFDFEFEFEFRDSEIRALVRRQPVRRWKAILTSMRIPAAMLPTAAWLAVWGYLGPSLVCLAIFAAACFLIGGMLWRGRDQVVEHAGKPRKLRIGEQGLMLEGPHGLTWIRWTMLHRREVEHGMLLLLDDSDRAWAAIPLRVPAEGQQPVLLRRIDAWLAAAHDPAASPPPAAASPLPGWTRLTAAVRFTPTLDDELDALALLGGSNPPRWSKRVLDALWLTGLAVIIAHLFDSRWALLTAPWAKYLLGGPVMLVALLLPQAFLRATEFIDRRYHRELLQANKRRRTPIQYTICREGLLSEGEDATALERWSAMIGLQSRRRMIVFTSSSGAIYFTPWSAFADHEQRTEFELQAERCFESRRESQERELTAEERASLDQPLVESGNPFQPPRM